MPDTAYLNPDTILRHVGGSWVASNPRLRVHVELDGVAAPALVRSAGAEPQSRAQWVAALERGKGRDRTSAAIGEHGLHADHSGLGSGDGSTWVAGEALFGLLTTRFVLIPDRTRAWRPVKPLSGILDRESLGTFHQRAGQRLLLTRRAQAWREWHDQKYSADGRTLRDTPYKALQEPFFDTYFSAARVEGRRVLDFGCGNAYFTAKLARRGAQIVGLDNSEELLEIARRNHGQTPGLELILTRSFDAALSRTSRWETGSFDLVYLQDTLLLLLQPETGEPSPQLSELLREFRRLLRHDGVLCAMEPNPVFWLASRYGDPLYPYAVVTEYRHPVFNVAPTLDRVLPVMAAGGFALNDLQHPKPAALESDRERCGGYSAEFPIWDFLVFVPV